jgi:hypothetical protein
MYSAARHHHFLELVKGVWKPNLVDLMPQQEATAMSILNQSSTTTNRPVSLRVSVTRPTGLPVVTGSVKFVFDRSTTPEVRPTSTYCA